MGNVYEACSKEETKTQYHFSIISNTTVMGDSSLMELTNKMKMEFLVKKGGSYRSSSITLTNEQPMYTSDKQFLELLSVATCNYFILL